VGAAALAELAGVSRRFGSTVALDFVDLEIRPAEVVALLGPNGAGKTTLVRILLGLIRATGGRATLFGLPPDMAAARRRVGAMLQVGSVPEPLTVREHVHLFSSYYGTPQPVDHTLAIAGITDLADRRFGELSNGQRQRALFALAICGRPELLVLDEPTVGLDLEARRTFWECVNGLITRGTSVLLTTHDLGEAECVSTRMVILRYGRVAASGRPEQLIAAASASTLYDAYFLLTITNDHDVRPPAEPLRP
jgi:ABC-2 type transport system ATP-binding protein